MKTARELGITTKERNGLVKVRDGLANGEYRHVKNVNKPAKDAKKAFNMNHWLDGGYHCGTVGCIGGWAKKAIGAEVDPVEAGWASWGELTNPSGGVDWDKITPAKAAKAIDFYLNGEEPWDFMRPKSERRAA